MKKTTSQMTLDTLETVKATLERNGDEWNLCAMLRATITAVNADISPADRVEVQTREPVELNGITEQLAEGSGIWRSCSGCHETNEGHSTGHHPYSSVMKCELGFGCSECGGIGAIWDTTDYEEMADFMAECLHPGLAQSEVKS